MGKFVGARMKAKTSDKRCIVQEDIAADFFCLQKCCQELLQHCARLRKLKTQASWTRMEKRPGKCFASKDSFNFKM